MLSLLAAVAILPFLSVAAEKAPRVVEWSKGKKYGPDGPWQAVSIGVGTDQAGNTLSKLDVYPGGFAYHLFFAKDFCSDQQADTCLPAEAGLYDYEGSSTSIENVTDGPGLVYTQASNVAIKVSGNASIMLDTVRMNTSEGLTTIEGSALDAIHAEDITLPNGATYNPQVGFLALGSKEGVRKYDRGEGQIIPNRLAHDNITPSASTSLHYGSANLGPEGSLIWGGYDQSRVIDQVGHFEISSPDSMMKPNLLDIQIGVETGGSPFDEDSYSGLLALNDTFGLHQPVIINPLVPYLSFSPETCQNIASHLPVTFNRALGLYTWDTANPQYKRITTSPSYIAFVFPITSTSKNSNTKSSSATDTTTPAPANLTIKVPFAHLDLTLEPPIVPTPQPYFPCQPFTPRNGDKDPSAFLGRTFLQSAFVAMNFDTATFFLAQAPGPDIVDPVNVKAIGPNDTAIESSPADRWGRSWEKSWTVLPPRPARASASNDGGDDAGTALSKGAIAGVSIGSVLAGLSLLALVAFLLWRRRQRQQAQREGKLGKDGEGGWAGSPSGVFEKDTMAASDSSAGTRSEVDGHSPIVEVGGRQRFEAPAAGTFMAELPGGNKALPELPVSGSHQQLATSEDMEEGGNVSSQSAGATGSGSGRRTWTDVSSGSGSGQGSGSGSGSDDLRKKFWRR